MTPSGWTIMLISVGTIVASFAWCLAKIFAHKPPGQGLHSPTEIDPHDREL